MNVVDRQKKVILIGGFHEIIELCEICEKQVIGIIDHQLTDQYPGYNILGDDRKAVDLYKKFKDIPIVITPDNPGIRKKLVKYYSEIGFKFCNIIHPNSNISKFSKIGKGVVIQFGVNISANVLIKDFVKINTSANVMHDSIISDYTTIAPNAVILGRVNVGEACYIGSNSTILPGKKIGKYSTIGAGSVVTKDVAKNEIVMGNPSRVTEKP